LAQTPSTGTLRPCLEESKDWDTTENLYIEGDNFEVLKLLQKSYHGRIRMIYVDPPYNTGKDILYKNNFSDNISNYLKLTEQVNLEGLPLSTNTKAGGRYHTNWLNIMFPVIRLGRNLLTDDGFMFITIDHFEVHNLIKICDELFGESNRIAIVTIQHNPKGRNQAEFFSENTEFMLVYAKSRDSAKFNDVAIDESVAETFDQRDENGKFRWENFIRARTSWSRKNKPNNWYPIYVSDDLQHISSTKINGCNEIYPVTNTGEFGWKNIRDTLDIMIRKGEIEARKKGALIELYHKYYEQQVLKNLWIEKKYQSEFFGTNVIKELFESNVFSFPKSIHAVEDSIKLSTNSDDIVLDFFSGSATAAHAVMKINSEDGGNREFIMVQLPEPTDNKSDAYKSGFENICEIGKERIRRAGDKIKAELTEKFNAQQGQMLVAEGEKVMNPDDLDIGFKVFKLDSSNLRKWQPDADNLEASLFDSIENFVEGRSELDVVYEIMLKYGIDLTLPIEDYKAGDKTIFSVGLGALMICLDTDITTEVAQEIVRLKGKIQPEVMRVVFRDTGFKDDSAKTNTKEILRTNGVDEIVSV